MHGGTEMKRLLGVLCIFITFSVYAATFLDTENRLWFTDDIVKNAIVEFVPEDKQQSVADLYQDLMDQETGKISIDSLFKVCRKAGFNTYKYEGFTQCKDFIQKMLTDAQIAEEVNIDGFCPGLDENGNNPNKLRSITDKTRIGDFCSSTNIRMGQVIFKPGYNCSCMATVCNDGFEFQGGACVTRIADGNGDCLREAYPKTSENNYLEKCKSFCEKKYAGRACKYTSVVMSHSTGECICNPNSVEINNAYESMRTAEETKIREEERRINSLKYYKVCGDDEGKTGGTEICVEGVFNWINVGRLQAVGLAEEYARVRYNDDIICDSDYRTSWNDDYVRCTSKNSKRYYEFQFDDIKESIDADIQRGVILGICKIYNVSVGMNSCATSCTAEMVRTAQHFGLTATTNGNICNFSGRSISADEAESKLAKIDGIDNYIFYSGIQIQGSKNVITQLKDYIKSTGKTVRSFDCIRNVDEIKNSLFVGDDDVLRCTLNGQPIDFVFDDFSESWLYVQEDGESKIQCIVSGGKYADQECFGLTQQQCLEANAVFKKKFPGASGMRWNGKECVLLDSAEAQRYDIYVQAGIGVVAAADCLLLTHTGCLVLAVETAGLATELTTKEFIENRAGEFLAVSTRCNNRDCAIDTIRNAGKVLSVMGSLDAAAANSVDSELARLVDYLEPEDLPNVSDNDWDEIIVQLGGDPDDTAGTALVWLNRIGLGAQFASLATSGYRLVSKAITRLAGKAARTANAASDAARAANNTADAANAASDASRAANNTADAANATSDASRATNATTNAATAAAADGSGSAANAASDAGRATDSASDAGRTAGTTGGSAGRGAGTGGAASASGSASDASRATNATSDASRTNRYIKKEIKPFSNYIGGSKEANGVWQVTDTQTGEVLFLKRTTANEIYLTQKAARVKLGTNPIVHIVQESEQNADEIAKALNITVPDYVKADKWLLTKQIPDGDDLMTVVSKGGFLSDGTKITNTEIDQLVSELQKLKSAGVNHSDLYTNTILRRGANGKLEAYIMDFESAGIHDVNFIARELESIKTIDNSANVARDINFDFGADIVQKTNRAATLRGGNTRPYNYYFINIDGMVRSDVQKLMDNLKNSGYDDVFLTRDNGKYVINASNPTIRGGKAIDNSRVQQFGIEYISRTKGANIGDNSVDASKISGGNNELYGNKDIVNPIDFKYSDGGSKLYVQNSMKEILGETASNDPSKAIIQIDDLYKKIRRGVLYSVNNRNVEGAIAAMEQPMQSNVLYIAPGKYPWHVHKAAKAPMSASYHISLNVDVNADLIRKLDNLMAADDGRHISNFKIPPVGERWRVMADPVSIYLTETSPQLERQIAEIAKEYVRTSESGLLGRKISDGVAIAFETSGNRADIVENIIQQVARKDPEIAQAIRSTGRFSVGATEALRIWASDFLGYKIEPVVP